MEAFLTPVVARLLSRFVKGAAGGGDAPDLRASLQGGGLALRNLELNLDPFLRGLPVGVRRAFARRLTVSIPWTSLASQPIEVVLDSVEVILAASADLRQAQGAAEGDGQPPDGTGRQEGSSEPLLGGGWMGGALSLLLRTLLNVTLTVNNLVISYAAAGSVAALRCESLCVQTAAEDWWEQVENPRSWLKKTVELGRLSLSLSSVQATDAAASLQSEPLLTLAGAHVAMLFPMFAVLEKQTAGSFEGQVDIDVRPLEAALTQEKLSLLAAFIAALPLQTDPAQGQPAAAPEAPSAAVPGQAAADAAPAQQPRRKPGREEAERRQRAAEAIYSAAGAAPASGVARLGAGAMRAAGSVWAFVSNEAAAAEGAPAATAVGADPPAVSALDVRVALCLTLQGGDLHLLHEPAPSVQSAPAPASPPRPRPPSAAAESLRVGIAQAAAASPLPGRLTLGNPAVDTPAALLPDLAAPDPPLPQEAPHLAASPSSPALGDDKAAGVDSGTGELPALDAGRAWLSLEWRQLCIRAALAEECLRSVDAALGSLCARRAVDAAASASHDEVLGVYPLEGVESAALLSEAGDPLALRLRWQPGAAAAAAAGPPARAAAASLQAGQLFAAYVPGLATQLLSFLAAAPALDLHAALPSSRGGSEEAAAAARSEEHRGDAGIRAQQPPGWLTGEASMGCSVLSLQLAALAGSGADSAALLFSADRASAHLGGLRAAARPGSLAAGMLGQLARPPTGQGLRAAVVGAQLGIATSWQHAASRQGCTDMAAAGVRAVCEPIELQAVVCTAQGAEPAVPETGRAGQPSSAAGPPSTSYAGSSSAGQQDKSTQRATDAWCAAAAASALQLRMRGTELAAALAVADGISAELARGLCAPFPQPSFPEGMQPQSTDDAWLGILDCSAGSVHLLWCPAGASSVAASLPAGADSSATALLRCASAIVTAAAADAQPLGGSMPALMLTLEQPHACFGASLHAAVPAVDIMIVSLAGPVEGKQQAAVHLGPPIAVLFDVALQQSSPEPLSSTAEQPAAAPLDLSLSVQDISFALALEQTTALASWLVTVSSGPALPAAPSYPPASLDAARSAINLSATAASLAGQLCTDEGVSAEQLAACCGVARGVSAWARHVAVRCRLSSWREPGAQVDARGHPRLPPSSEQHVELSLRSCESALLSAGQDDMQISSWALRCMQETGAVSAEPSQPGMQVQLDMRSGGEGARRSSQSLAVDAQSLAARLSPELRQQLQALAGAAAAGAARAQQQQQPPRVDEAARKLDAPSGWVRCALRWLSVEAAAELRGDGEDEAKDTSEASGQRAASGAAAGAARAALTAQDAVLLMHDSMGERARPWPLPAPASSAVDISAVGARVTLFGPGLPFRGAPLLLPVDVHAALTRLPGSLAVRVMAQFLFLQLPLPGLRALQSLAQAMVEPEVERQQANEACSSLTDDLRCGLFSPAPSHFEQLGPLQVAWGSAAQEGLGLLSPPQQAWVSWRFAHPRPVRSLLIRLPPSLMTAGALHLAYGIDEAAQEFMPAPFFLEALHEQAPVGNGSSDVLLAQSTLLTVQEGVPAAETWRLTWQPHSGSAAGSLAASDLLSALHVNPAGMPPLGRQQRQQVPDLAVPLTVALSAGGARLALSLGAGDDDVSADVSDACMLESDVTLHLQDIQAVCHSWAGTTALRACATCSVACHDAASLTEELLLEPCRLGAALQLRGSCPSAACDKHANGSDAATADAAAAQAVRLRLDEELLLLPLAPPSHTSTRIQLRVGEGPLTLRLSELGAHNLLRLGHHMALAFGLSAQFGSSSLQQGHAHAAVRPATAPAVVPPPIELRNCCPLDLWVGQAGTPERLALPSGAACPYTWQTPPGLHPSALPLLRLHAAGPPPLQPASTGKHSSSTVAEPVTAPEQCSGLFDAMAASAAVISVQLPGRGAAVSVAVHVAKEAHTWRVTLRPSHVLLNRTGRPLQLCIAGAGPAAAQPGALQALELPPLPQGTEEDSAAGASGALAVMALTASPVRAAGAPTTLRAWLGPGNGWSRPAQLTGLAEEAQLLQAAGLGADAPAPPKAQAGAAIGAVLCQAVGPDPASGQMHVLFWPLLLLRSELPWELCCRQLSAMGDGAGVGAVDVDAMLQPGGEAALALTAEGGQSVSLRLPALGSSKSLPQATQAAAPTEQAAATMQPLQPLQRRGSWLWAQGRPAQEDSSTGSANPDGWTAPLLFTGLHKDKGSRWWGGGASQQQAVLPAAGQFCCLPLARSQAELQCLLLADPHPQCKEVTRLSLVAPALLDNATPLALSLELPDAGPSIAAPPQQATPSSWQSLRQRPRQACLALQLPGAEGKELMRSKPFDLEHGTHSMAALLSQSAGSPAALYLSVRVDITERPGLQPIGGAAGPCDTLCITVAPGILVTNLTQQPLHLAPCRPAAWAPQQAQEVAAGATQPVLAPWQARRLQECALLVSLRQDACEAALHAAAEATDAGQVQPAESKAQQQTGFAESFVSFLEGEGAAPDLDTSSSGVAEDLGKCGGVSSGPDARLLPLLAAQGRRTRLQLADEKAQVHLVTCRVLHARGQLHAVFFQDEQPPVVGFSWVAGSAEDTEPILVSTVAAGAALECALPEESSAAPAGSRSRSAAAGLPTGAAEAGPLEDAEEEEAFLEAVTGQRSAAIDSGQPEQVTLLRVRVQGSAQWAALCSLLPGSSCTSGGVQVTVWQDAATLHVGLEDPSPHEQANSSPCHATAAEAGDSSMHVAVAVECFQISAWDDARRRLLGPQAAAAGPAPAQEAFCLALDGLALGVQSQSTPGSNGAQSRGFSMHAEAQGLQLDSYLPGSSHPVVCRSEDAAGAADAGSALLQVALEVCQSPKQPLRRSWVRRVAARVPVLALALDDALLAFAERAARLLAPAAAPPVAVATLALSAATDSTGPLEHAIASGAASSESAAERAAAAAEGGAGGCSRDAAWRRQAAAEAAVAASGRLLIEELDVGPLQLLVDVHLSGGGSGSSARLPVTVDTSRSPVTVSALRGRRLLFRPAVLAAAAAAHACAEALLSAPRVLGSLDLLLNPTGLLASLGAGLRDLLGLPLAALQAGSPAQFVAGLGRGGASLVWHVSGWSLASLAGFSAAASRALQRSLAARRADMAAAGLQAPTEPGLVSGLRGLACGVTAGVTGYADGTGVAAGVGRGLLGALGLPLSGALDLVAGVASGIASSTGVAPRPHLRRPPSRELRSAASAALCRRQLAQLQGSGAVALGAYIAHCSAADAMLVGEDAASSAVLGALTLPGPLLVLTQRCLMVIADGGLGEAAVLQLAGARMHAEHGEQRLQLHAQAGSCAALGSAGSLQLQARVPDGMWFVMCAVLREAIAAAEQHPV